VDAMGPDLTRPAQSSALQLELTLHVPFHWDGQTDDVEAQDVRTLVRWFCEPGRSHLYEAGAFVYTWGSFLCQYTAEDGLEVVVQAHSVDR
jgi:hypothetical protein